MTPSRIWRSANIIFMYVFCEQFIALAYQKKSARIHTHIHMYVIIHMNFYKWFLRALTFFVVTPQQQQLKQRAADIWQLLFAGYPSHYCCFWSAKLIGIWYIFELLLSVLVLLAWLVNSPKCWWLWFAVVCMHAIMYVSVCVCICVCVCVCMSRGLIANKWLLRFHVHQAR